MPWPPRPAIAGGCAPRSTSATTPGPPTGRSRRRCWRRSGRVSGGSDPTPEPQGLVAQAGLVDLPTPLERQLVLPPPPEVARHLVAGQPLATVGYQVVRGRRLPPDHQSRHLLP